MKLIQKTNLLFSSPFNLILRLKEKSMFFLRCVGCGVDLYIAIIRGESTRALRYMNLVRGLLGLDVVAVVVIIFKTM